MVTLASDLLHCAKAESLALRERISWYFVGYQWSQNPYTAISEVDLSGLKSEAERFFLIKRYQSIEIRRSADSERGANDCRGDIHFRHCVDTPMHHGMGIFRSPWLDKLRTSDPQTIMIGSSAA